MKILNKALSLFLCVVMTFSFAVMPSAVQTEKEETTEFSYSLKYYTDRSDLSNVSAILDQVDKWLAEKNYSVSVKTAGIYTIKIDLTSINAVCNTIDTFGGLIESAVVVLRPFIKDMAELNLDSWQKGMKRGNQDITIVKEFIELLYNNKALIRKLCDGTLDAGVFNEVFNLDKLVGPDGISGTIKKWIISLVYEKDGTEYNNAYKKYKNNFDAFIYGDFLNHFADLYLPGFKMNENSTVESLICVAFGLVVEKYIRPIITEISIDTANSEYEALRALDGLINLNGSTYDFSKIKFDSSKSFLSQVNMVVGEIFTQLIPGYKWQSGNYDKISENIEGAFKYLGKTSGLIANADELSFDEIVMQVIAILVKNVDLQGIGEGVTECETLEDMAKVALINITGNLGLGTTYKNEDSYLLVLGDIAAHYLYNNFVVTDLSGKTLVPGMGYDVFQVANFALNYLLYDKQLGAFLGLEDLKDKSAFTKVDKILDYFAESKSKGVTFDSEKFIYGDGKSKGLLDAIFSLDIEYILDITAVPALKNAGNVPAVKFIYNCLRNFLNNWSGKKMIPQYTTGAFKNALKNDNVAVFVEYFIEILSKRNASFIKVAALVGAVLFNGDDILLGEVSAKVSDTVYSGGAISPKATVTLKGKTLTQYSDFVVVCSDAKIGQSTAVIKGIGLYKGTSSEIPFNLSLGQIKNLKAVTVGNVLRLSWQSIPGAVAYTVESASYSTQVKENSAEIQVVPGETYTFTVAAIGPDGSKSVSASVTAKAEPEQVKNLRAENVTDKSMTLLWKSVTGATSYRVEIYDETAKEWKPLDNPTTARSELKNLTASGSMKLRVCAVFDVDGIHSQGQYSDTLTVSLKPSKVKNLDVDTVTDKTVSLSWDKVKGAKGYEVYIVEGYENTFIKAVTSTSCKITGLDTCTEYTFKVRAYAEGEVYGDLSSGVKTTTLPSKVKSLKTEKTSASYIKISWKKVSGADKYIVYIYKGGEWVKYKSTTSTAITIKSLTAGTTYKFRVKAYNSEGKVYSEFSDTLSAGTRVAKASKPKVSSVKTTSLKLSWSKLKGADGYVVYYSTDNKTWKKIDSTSKTAMTVKSLKSKKTYYFKLRGYSKSTGKAVYGEYSSVLKVKTK